MLNDVIWIALSGVKTLPRKSRACVSLLSTYFWEASVHPLVTWTMHGMLHDSAWLATSHFAHASIGADEAAERAIVSKRVKYFAITINDAFVAVALETCGSWNREGLLQFISELGSWVTHNPWFIGDLIHILVPVDFGGSSMGERHLPLRDIATTLWALLDDTSDTTTSNNNNSVIIWFYLNMKICSACRKSECSECCILWLWITLLVYIISMILR